MTQTTTITKQLLTQREVATYCGVSEMTVRRWLAAGKLPTVTLPSGRRKIRLSDLEAVLQADYDGQSAAS